MYLLYETTRLVSGHDKIKSFYNNFGCPIYSSPAKKAGSSGIRDNNLHI
jgi:hypothetical protein